MSSRKKLYQIFLQQDNYDLHLADAFIQSDLQAMHFLSVCVLPGIEPTTFCFANTMLYH